VKGRTVIENAMADQYALPIRPRNIIRCLSDSLHTLGGIIVSVKEGAADLVDVDGPDRQSPTDWSELRSTVVKAVIFTISRSRDPE